MIFGSGSTNIIKSEYFRTDKVVVEDRLIDNSNPETFYAYNVVNGSGRLIVNSKEYEIKLGDSFIIPAGLGEYAIEGDLELLKSYV